MRRWLAALTASSLFLLFPLAMGYLPYDHWDHAWGSVNLVLALGLLCVTLCAALIRAQSASSQIRLLLLGTAVVSLIATRLGAPVLAVVTQFGRGIFSVYHTMATAIAIAAVMLPAILASNRTRKAPLHTGSSVPLWLQSSVGNVLTRLTPRYSPLRI